ncbi:hypothetical protein NM688_g6192 [Phlebia brevispora]|uniref:Uncharacterized protein n=1 Tax=Phlebia brevispora TaxID=194682 RepID=A0ACC1SIS0_9APHY|nr:hypothetical protein NM688_g6192 [Phlebia brevispora]
MESYQYSQFPPELSNVHITLFTEVTNAAHLRTRLIQAATMPGPEGEAEREAVNFSFIDARLITSRLHLQTAIYHAILASVQGSLRTKTVHSEVLWNLNPTNNITEAIRRYGVSEDTKALFVVRIDKAIPDVADKIAAVVQGKLTSLDDLAQITDWSSIKKYNKLNNEPAVQQASKDLTRQQAIVDEIVTSRRGISSSSPRKQEMLPDSGRDRAAVGVFTPKAAALFLATGVGLFFYFKHEKEKLIEQRQKELEDKQVGRPKVGGPFSLITHQGKPFTEKDLLGKWSLIYFGFTNCPDICPEELDKMGEAVEELGA